MTIRMTVAAVLPPTEEFQKMLDIFNACNKAKIQIPDQVWDYFGGREPVGGGMEIAVPGAVQIRSGETHLEYYIDLSKLPGAAKQVKVRTEWDAERQSAILVDPTETNSEENNGSK